MMMLEATDPIARPLNPAAPRSALSNCRIPLAGLRRGLASNKVPGRIAGLPIWRAASKRYLCKEHEQEREKNKDAIQAQHLREAAQGNDHW
jgi:hypothetical protein